jgi:hypothetical protein
VAVMVIDGITSGVMQSIVLNIRGYGGPFREERREGAIATRRQSPRI